MCGTEIYVAAKAGYSLLYGALPVTQPRRPPGSHLTTLTFTLTQQQATSSPPLFPLGLPPSDYRPLPSLLHLPYKCGDTASLRGERLSPFLTLSLYFSTSLHVSGSASPFSCLWAEWLSTSLTSLSYDRPTSSPRAWIRLGVSPPPIKLTGGSSCTSLSATFHSSSSPQTFLLSTDKEISTFFDL